MFNSLTRTLIFICFSVSAFSASAAKKAVILGDQVEVYEAADFDSAIIDEVYRGQTYQVSDKNIGPFYKIKLKNGKIGYVVDYQLNIEGKGPLQPKDLDQIELLEEQKIADLLRKKKGTKEDEKEEEDVFGKPAIGPFVMMLNYHEKTMGSEQVDDIAVVGVKSVAVFAWSAMLSTVVPKYYTKQNGFSGSGVNLWADLGFSNTVAQFPSSAVRFSGNIFTHFSSLKIETPVQKYDLQDITMGVNVELAWNYKFKSTTTDIALKYYFDKSSYAGLGVGLLF